MKPATPGAVERGVQRRSPQGSNERRDLVASEVPVALHYNDAPFAVLMATPCDLADLALGFSLSEAVVGSPNELRIDGIDETVDGIAVRMAIPASRAEALEDRRRNLPGYGGCGVCGSATVESVLRPPPTIASELRIADGELRLVREDVGRHNALDKLIGATASAGFDAGSGFAIVTSRASYELAMKAAQVGIPLLAAISAPTALAIALADSARLCLVGFARDGHCAVYAHAGRLLR